VALGHGSPWSGESRNGEPVLLDPGTALRHVPARRRKQVPLRECKCLCTNDFTSRALMAGTCGSGIAVSVAAMNFNRTILIVDDDAAISAPLAKYFRGLGHAVDVAAEAEEAAALLVFQRYDAAILDLRLTNLGGAEGLALLHEIRERDARTSVVVLSAYISREARAEAIKRGANAVLQKPHPLADLARRVLGESPQPCPMR